jgi:hypothetical protein
MFVLAFGGYGEALLCALARLPEIRNVLLVREGEWRESAFREPVIVCRDVLPDDQRSELIALRHPCERCGKLGHYVLDYDEFRSRAFDILTAAGLLQIADTCSLRIAYSGSIDVRTGTRTFTVETAEQLTIFAQANFLEWVSSTNLKIKCETKVLGGCVSYFKARARDGVRLTDMGEISKDGLTLSWLRVDKDEFLVKSIGMAPGCTPNQVQSYFGLDEVELLLNSKFKQSQAKPALFKKLSMLALLSFMKKWLLLYLITWWRVVVSMFLVARARSMTIDGVLKYSRLGLEFVKRSLQRKGFTPTTLWLFRAAVYWLSFMERRVRELTDSKFLSLSLVISVFQIVAMSSLREGSRYLWAKFVTRPELEFPVVEAHLLDVSPRPEASTYNLVLVNSLSESLRHRLPHDYNV